MEKSLPSPQEAADSGMRESVRPARQIFLHRQDGVGEALRLRIRFTGYSSWKFPEAFTWPEHEHLDFEIIVPRVGTYRCSLNEVPVELTSGRLLLIKPGDRHADHCEAGVDYFGINFRIEDPIQEDTSLPLFDSRAEVGQQVISVPVEHCETFARKMTDAESLQAPWAAHVQDAILGEFFWRLVPQIPLEALSPLFRTAFGQQDFQMRLERVFTRHLYESLALPEMARAVGLPVRTLTHQCQEILGDSPARLFRAFKLKYAASLLRNSTRPIKEISYMLGFANPYHFSRCFKERNGLSPAAYRQQPPVSNPPLSP